ncbi:Protein N-acetyltransferase, RimJ/RimL family [Marininema mesophilum]|uniref:Protein N-acetyltransferase, RimJ/RimL family n=1 Tax=Marininema mesophilum TaxID=1048340 RepID=A0A1H2YEF9_9BACL|nr:GNAT family protein [Marininema mesophilum]SDX03566.1 Protein N-acetyltransferase, RimJ/RimL family [Marininema mesophilum]
MLRLEAISPEDFSTLISWTDTPEFLLQWAGPPFHYPLTEEQLYAHWQVTKGEQPLRRIFKAVDLTTSEMIGHIELNNIDMENRLARLSRVLINPQIKGRGIGTDMVREVVRMGFKEIGLHRIDLLVFNNNLSAISCYKRVGFRKEGSLRECRRLGERYLTLDCMSILEYEWVEKNCSISSR